MLYAKIIDNQLVYPNDSEFQGVPNWRTNDQACRRRGYTPLVGDPEDREGYRATPATWHAVQQSETRTEPRREDPVTGEPFMEDVLVEDPDTHETRKVGTRRATRDVPVVFDTSYIQVDTWEYTEIPAPAPVQDQEDISDQIRQLVEMIQFYADKYTATEDLLAMEDVNIESLEALIDKYQVTADDKLTIMTKVQMRVLEIMATCRSTWHDIWAVKVKPAMTQALHPDTASGQEPDEPAAEPGV